MTSFGDLNLKFPLILAISVFMSHLNLMLCRVEHEKSFICSRTGPEQTCSAADSLVITLHIKKVEVIYKALMS